MSTTPNTSPFNLAYQLANEPSFGSRVRSCMWQQAQTYQSDADTSNSGLANDILRGNYVSVQPMINMIAAFPGLIDPPVTLTLGDGTQSIDQTAITDEAILGQVQANWHTIATLFYLPPAP